jgi:lipoate-protein ligase A
MGRGRAKAKQTKVARELKYSSPTMDLDALARELGGGTVLHQEDDGDINDPYAPDDYDEDDRRR